MVSVDVNEKDLKENLSKIYKAFLENPEDKLVKRNAKDYDNKYGGLCGRGHVSEKLERAISGLSTIYQYGMHGEDHPAFSNKKIIEVARNRLSELKNEK